MAQTRKRAGIAKKSAPKKASAKKPAKKVAAKKKKRVLTPKKSAARKVVSKKSAAKKSASKKTSSKKISSKKTSSKRGSPMPSPSQVAVQACTTLPKERSLTDEERDAMAKVAQSAANLLDAHGDPESIVHRIGAFVDEVRSRARTEPKSQDIRLGLGVLWGEQVRNQVGWSWVHLTYPDGFASYALVPDDRAFACFPLNRIVELMHTDAHHTNTSIRIFDSICSARLPARRDNAYLVIG